MRPIIDLDYQYAGQTLWVIGRGPSLARLSARHIGPGPVVAINQAIERVEKLGLCNPVYSMQKDQVFVECKAPIIAHALESAKGREFGAYAFDCTVDYGLPWDVPSVVVCAAMARRWGCAEVVYLCCDAAFGNTEAYGAPATYPRNYLLHAPMVQRYARLPVEWKRI